MSIHPPGYNPIRWDCERQGCFNKKVRPKIEEFADCFPGNNAMGDLDGVVEHDGKLLIMEWKSSRKGLEEAQNILAKNISDGEQITYLEVVGNAETMEVMGFRTYMGGEANEWQRTGLAGLKKFMKSWADWAWNKSDSLSVKRGGGNGDTRKV